ncbi:MAG: hypothetical protein IKM35_04045 [Bacteroidaceae bacterium]|nr:hypothetical protein [Bacteroidaceae bacterium]
MARRKGFASTIDQGIAGLKEIGYPHIHSVKEGEKYYHIGGRFNTAQ